MSNVIKGHFDKTALHERFIAAADAAYDMVVNRGLELANSAVSFTVGKRDFVVEVTVFEAGEE